MAACVYCDTPLSPGTKPAHVIPSALGGRLKSRRYCCSECNNAISEPERTLAEALRVFTSMLGIKRGDNRRAPRVRMLDKVHGPLAADSGQADRPFRPMPITRSGKAITRGADAAG